MKAVGIFLALSLAASMCGCASKSADKPKKSETTTAAATQTEAAESSLPEESFEKLPDGAEKELDTVSLAASTAFPDASGRKMFGFKGMETLTLGGEAADCYVFDYYTYSKKTYTKRGTLAKSIDDESVFMLDDMTGEYLPCVCEEEQTSEEIAAN